MPGWRGLTIKTRILLALGAVLTAVVVVGVVIWFKVGWLEEYSQRATALVRLNDTLGLHRVNYLQWVHELGNGLLAGKARELRTDISKTELVKWLASADRARAEALVPAVKPVVAKLEAQTLRLKGAVGKLVQAIKAGRSDVVKIYQSQCLPALEAAHHLLEQLHKIIKAEAHKAEAQVVAEVRGVRLLVIIGFGLLVLFGLVVVWAAAHTITSDLQQISTDLEVAAGEVASAAEQVSSAGQSLADGASRQAASLEETSSAMEEMSATTRQNADSTRQARSSGQEVLKAVEEAARLMEQTTKAMAEIKSAGEEVSRIIRTIDEIAFQTNILALNAAVEAARAGQAGAGFAVVADEVRRLALRTADAAGDTARIIDEVVENINRGVNLVEKTQQAFQQVLEHNRTTGRMVEEIAEASGQQAVGLEQITGAMNEINVVTQEVAALAQQSAAASQQLAGQATSMRGMVKDLAKLSGRRQEGEGLARKVGKGAAQAIKRLKGSQAGTSTEQEGESQEF